MAYDGHESDNSREKREINVALKQWWILPKAMPHMKFLSHSLTHRFGRH